MRDHDKPLRQQKSCQACLGALNDQEAGSYAICSSCGSANYIPVRSALADNKVYFDTVYSQVNHQVIEKRYRYFVACDKLHSFLHSRELNKFQSLIHRIAGRIISAGKSLEIGFGYGHELVNYLRAGANIYGLDLSEEAVSKFRSTYPEYGARVFCATHVEFQVDVIYCNALFEHLDDPGTFLNNAAAMLNSGGAILMRLPLIMTRHFASEHLRWDINFWKPCHRTLFTMNGLNILLRNHGFQIMESAPFAYYGYKVMSSMLRHGYHEIEEVRNPCFAIKGLESDWLYLKMLIESLFRRVICSDFALVATKA